MIIIRKYHAEYWGQNLSECQILRKWNPIMQGLGVSDA